MSELKTTHPISLQFLINEDLYLTDPIENLVQTADLADMPALTESTKQEASVPVSFDYLGDNNKYFLLLVDYSNQAVMDPKELEALQSILGAKKMELKDIALLNLNKYPAVSFAQLKDYFACSKAVLFGINPQRLKLPAIGSNEIISHEGASLLGTFSFTEMMDNVDKKKVFWNVMKGF